MNKSSSKRQRKVKPRQGNWPPYAFVRVYLHIGVFLDRQVEDLARVVIQTPDNVVQGQASVADGGQQQWQHRFQARVTGWRTLTVLLLERVGG